MKAFFFTLLQILKIQPLMKKIRYQRVDILIASGSLPSIEPVKVFLETGYERCIGIAYYESKDGGISHYNIGLKDDNMVYHDLTHKKDWEPIASERYKPISFRNHKGAYYVQVQNEQDLTDDIKGQVVFVLEGDEQS